jgi:hypothetical protein
VIDRDAATPRGPIKRVTLFSAFERAQLEELVMRYQVSGVLTELADVVDKKIAQRGGAEREPWEQSAVELVELLDFTARWQRVDGR